MYLMKVNNIHKEEKDKRLTQPTESTALTTRQQSKTKFDVEDVRQDPQHHTWKN